MDYHLFTRVGRLGGLICIKIECTFIFTGKGYVTIVRNVWFMICEE